MESGDELCETINPKTYYNIMKENLRDFNGAAKFFLLIPIFTSVTGILTTISKIRIGAMLGYAVSSYALEIFFSVLVIVATIFTLTRKRFGLISLLTIIVIKVFATYPMGGNMSFSYFLGTQFAYFIRDFGLFFIAMFFKKDGISGWTSMLASEEYVEANTIRQEDPKE